MIQDRQDFRFAGVVAPLWQPVAGMVLAAALWFVMFSPWTSPHINFWLVMTLAAVSRSTWVVLCDRGWLRRLRPSLPQVVVGIVLALVLWGVFWTGDKVSQVILSGARDEVDLIYGMSSGTPSWLIGLLLLLVIGPAEEIFWRGFVQRRLSQRWSADTAMVVTLVVYTLIHAWSMNVMLILAAMVAGAFWGWLYRLFPRWLPALVLSHALWDTLSFVVIPY